MESKIAMLSLASITNKVQKEDYEQCHKLHDSKQTPHIICTVVVGGGGDLSITVVK